MTSYAAYDAGLPCKNPSCKSHGKPHPNCRCYGGALTMAEGGEVENHFCSEDRPHEKNCEYYAEGGMVPSHEDPELSVASYLSHQGLHGLLKMDQDNLGKYNHNVRRGQKHLDLKVGHLFGGKSSDNQDYGKAHQSIENWIDKGGITHDLQQEIYNENAPQQFAEGGNVQKPEGITHNHEIADSYPEQNVLLQAAKGRMSNYLNGIKPQKNMPKLAFDDEPDTREQERSYKRAVKISAEPLRVLDKIKDGTIEPEHVKHLKALHPEVDNVLQKKITQKIIEAQLKGEKPDYKTRQGLSMFLGTPLSGEMKPQNIQAAQASLQMNRPQEQGPAPVTKNKKNTSSLSKSDQSFLTSNQARTERQQKGS